MENIRQIEVFMKEHKGKSDLYRVLTILTKSYYFAPIFLFLFFVGVNIFLCAGIVIVFAAVGRFLYVRFKHDWQLNAGLYKYFKVCRENELRMTFRV
jgi:hypothetical protein